MDINERCYGYEPAQSQLTQLQTTVMNLHVQLDKANENVLHNPEWVKLRAQLEAHDLFRTMVVGAVTFTKERGSEKSGLDVSLEKFLKMLDAELAAIGESET